jgi:hypothetical protein
MATTTTTQRDTKTQNDDCMYIINTAATPTLPNALIVGMDHKS